MRGRSRSPRAWRGCAPSDRRSRPQDVAGDGPFDGSLGVVLDVAASPKCRIDRVEIKRGQAPSDALHFRGCQRDVVGIGPHERDVHPVPRHQHGVPGQEGATLGKMQNRAAGKMAAEPMKRDIRQDIPRLSGPEFYARIGLDKPLPVSLVHEHGTVKRPAPRRHRAVEMRMGNSNRLDSAQRANDLDGRVIQKAEAVPKDVARGGNDQEGPLSDRELWHRGNAKQAGSHFTKNVEAADRQRFRGDPFLTCGWNELPRILADQATFGWHRTLWMLDAASLA